MSNKNTRVSKNAPKQVVKSSKNTKVVPKKSKKKDTSRIGFLLFTVVMFLVILVSTIFNDVEQIMYNKKQTELLNNKYVELLEEEASLNNEVTKLQDSDYLERYAREKYMYTKDGEKILTIIEPGKRIQDDDNKVDEDAEKTKESTE